MVVQHHGYDLLMEHARVSKVFSVIEKPLLLGGADFHLELINIAVLVFMLMVLRLWQWIPMTYLIHLMLKQVARRDHHSRKIYIRYSLQADRYEPWASPRQKRGMRPSGFGRGELC
ncbi:MAG: VirB3 family type IV secretion system protein [Anaerolineae bacterium]|nr:VirB3 family type IV secretion system protein [Anaerolineae bacterium]MCZ2112733.1 VirB3 family type IV secretion system protein [Anaerolineae bacterium]